MQCVVGGYSAFTDASAVKSLNTQGGLAGDWCGEPRLGGIAGEAPEGPRGWRGVQRWKGCGLQVARTE